MNIYDFRRELAKLGFEYYNKTYMLNLNSKSIEVFADYEFSVYINDLKVYGTFREYDLTYFLSEILNIIRSIKLKAILNG